MSVYSFRLWINKGTITASDHITLRTMQDHYLSFKHYFHHAIITTLLLLGGISYYIAHIMGSPWMIGKTLMDRIYLSDGVYVGAKVYTFSATAIDFIISPTMFVFWIISVCLCISFFCSCCSRYHLGDQHDHNRNRIKLNSVIIAGIAVIIILYTSVAFAGYGGDDEYYMKYEKNWSGYSESSYHPPLTCGDNNTKVTYNGNISSYGCESYTKYSGDVYTQCCAIWNYSTTTPVQIQREYVVSTDIFFSVCIGLLIIDILQTRFIRPVCVSTTSLLLQ